MRDDDALRPGVQQAQDEVLIVAGNADHGGHAGQVRGHDHLVDQTEVEGGVLHVDERRVEAGQADDLDHLRVGEGYVGAQGEAVFAQRAPYSVFLH